MRHDTVIRRASTAGRTRPGSCDKTAADPLTRTPAILLPPAPAPRGRILPGRAKTLLFTLLAVALCAWAVDFLFRDVSWAGLKASLARQDPWRVAASLALTAASFACLAAYDALGAAMVAPGKVRRRTALLAGASASAVANTLGFHAVTGSAVRAHVYAPAGLRGAEIARVVSLSWLSLIAGNVAMLSIAELLQSWASRHASAHDVGVHLAIGGALAGLLAVFVGWLAGGPRQLSIRRARFPLPGARRALVLMAIGAVESGTAVGALYVLLPADLAPPFALFAVSCIASVALGVVAHTPGGLGVFEASLAAMLAGRGRADLLAAFLVYRLVYNLLPFALAVAVLAWRAWRRR